MWVQVSVPLPPGGTLTGEQVAAMVGTSTGPFRLQITATNQDGNTTTNIPLSVSAGIPPVVTRSPPSAAYPQGRDYVVPTDIAFQSATPLLSTTVCE